MTILFIGGTAHVLQTATTYPITVGGGGVEKDLVFYYN